MSELNEEVSRVRAFLLGRLPDSEKSRIERLRAADTAYALFFAAAEDDLVMDYAHRRLSEEEQQRVDRYYLTANEANAAKVQFARTLAESLARQKRAKRNRVIGACTVLAGILPLAVWAFETTTVAADVAPLIYRGMGPTPSVHIGFFTRTIRLRLHCNQSLARVAAIIRPTGSTQAVLDGIVEAPNGVGIWPVPARLFQSGEYVIQIAPDTADAETFLISIEK